MMSVTKIMTTETAHRLCNYAGKCAHIHGHSYRWEVTVSRDDGEVQENGILIDFADLKVAMKTAIFNSFDHALVLWKGDPLQEYAWQMISSEQSMFSKAADGETPQNIFWFEENPTAENFAEYAAKEVQRELLTFQPCFYVVQRVRVWETANSYGEWSLRN